MTSIQNLLYANWLKRLKALREEAAKHDFSPEGEAAYTITLMEAKQAYNLLHTTETKQYDDGMKAVYG